MVGNLERRSDITYKTHALGGVLDQTIFEVKSIKKISLLDLNVTEELRGLRKLKATTSRVH